MGRNSYSDEVRAQVVGKLLTGQGVDEVAAEYDIPEGTVRSWKSRALAENVASEKNERVGALLIEYITEALLTVREQQAHFRDVEWLRKQGAAELATLHGVTVDKVARLLEAMSPHAGADTE